MEDRLILPLLRDGQYIIALNRVCSMSHPKPFIVWSSNSKRQQPHQNCIFQFRSRNRHPRIVMNSCRYSRHATLWACQRTSCLSPLQLQPDCLLLLACLSRTGCRVGIPRIVHFLQARVVGFRALEVDTESLYFENEEVCQGFSRGGWGCFKLVLTPPLYPLCWCAECRTPLPAPTASCRRRSSPRLGRYRYFAGFENPNDGRIHI